MSQSGSAKARKVLAALLRIGWTTHCVLSSGYVKSKLERFIDLSQHFFRQFA
jgi:hypothetical protein